MMIITRIAILLQRTKTKATARCNDWESEKSWLLNRETAVDADLQVKIRVERGPQRLPREGGSRKRGKSPGKQLAAR